MGRPKFRITVDNLMHAARYLDGRLGSLSVVPLSMSAQDGRAIIGEILMAPKSEESAKRLQTWCDDNLNLESMRSLNVAIRKRKQRTASDSQRVLSVTTKAYALLSKLAKRDKVTLSKALERAAEKCLRSSSAR